MGSNPAVISYFSNFPDTAKYGQFLSQLPPLGPSSPPDLLCKIARLFRVSFSAENAKILRQLPPLQVSSAASIGLDCLSALLAAPDPSGHAAAFNYCCDYLHTLRVLCQSPDMPADRVCRDALQACSVMASAVCSSLAPGDAETIRAHLTDVVKRGCALVSDVLGRAGVLQSLPVVKSSTLIVAQLFRLVLAVFRAECAGVHALPPDSPAAACIRRLCRGALGFVAFPGMANLLRALCQELAIPGSEVAQFLPRDFAVTVAKVALGALATGLLELTEYSDATLDALLVLDDAVAVVARQQDHVPDAVLQALGAASWIALKPIDIQTLRMALSLQHSGTVPQLAPMLGLWCATRDGEAGYGRCEAVRTLIGLLGLSSSVNEKARDRMQDDFAKNYNSASVDATAMSLTALSPTKHLPLPAAPYSFLLPVPVLIESCKSLFLHPPESAHDRFLRTCLPFVRFISAAIVNTAVWDVSPPFSLRESLCVRDNAPCAILATLALRLLKQSRQRDTSALIEVCLLHLYFAGLRDSTFALLSPLLADLDPSDRPLACQAVWAVCVLRVCGFTVPGHRAAAVASFVGCALPVTQTSLDPSCPYLAGPTSAEDMLRVDAGLKVALGDSWSLCGPEVDMRPAESALLGPGPRALVILARAVALALRRRSFVCLRAELRPLLTELAHGPVTRLTRLVLLQITELLTLAVAHSGAVTEAYTYSKKAVDYAVKMGAFNAAAGLAVCAAGLRISPHFCRPLDSLTGIFRYHIYGGNRPLLGESSDSLPITRRLAETTNEFAWWILRALECLSKSASKVGSATIGTASLGGVLLVAQAALAASAPTQYSLTGRLSAIVLTQIARMIHEAAQDRSVPPVWRAVPAPRASSAADFTASFRITATIVSARDVSEGIGHHIAMPELLQSLSLIYAMTKAVQGDIQRDRFARARVPGGDAAIAAAAALLAEPDLCVTGAALVERTAVLPLEEFLMPAYLHARYCEHTVRCAAAPALDLCLNDLTERRYCEFAGLGQVEAAPEPVDDFALPPDLDLAMPALSDDESTVEEPQARDTQREAADGGLQPGDLVVLSAYSEPLAPSHIQPSNARPLVVFTRTIPPCICPVLSRVLGREPPAIVIRRELPVSSDLPVSSHDISGTALVGLQRQIERGILPRPAWSALRVTGVREDACAEPPVCADGYRFAAPPSAPLILQQPDPLLADGAISIAQARRFGQPRLPLLAETDAVTAALLAQYSFYEEAANTFTSVALPTGPQKTPAVPAGAASKEVGRVRRLVNAGLCSVFSWAEERILGHWSALLRPSRGELPCLEPVLRMCQRRLRDRGVSEETVAACLTVAALAHSCGARLSETAAASLSAELVPEAADVMAQALRACVTDVPPATEEQPVRLLLHGAFSHFPVESWPSLIDHPAVRVISPSFALLRRPAPSPHETPRGFYVIDPDSTLAETKEVVLRYIQESSALQSLKWTGCAGAEETAAAGQEQLAAMVGDASLFVYCGHGSGQTWVPPRLVDARTAGAALLMGCSSAAPALAPGVPTVAQQLLGAGVRAVIGSLTDVTDQDTNRVTHCLMERFDPADPAVLARQLVLARHEC